MKKLSLYTLLLVSALTALTSCTEDFNKDVAAPQSWKQEDGKTISFSAVAASATTIDLATVTTDSVAICSFTAPPVSEGQTIKGFDIVLDGTVKLNVNAHGQVAKADLQSAVTKLYGKRPAPRTMKSVVNAYMSTNGQVFRASSDVINIIVTPVAPLIESAYYLIGDMNGWDGAKLIKFNHSDKDVYEDSYFSVIVKIPANSYWKIIPQSNVDAGNVWADGVLGTITNGDTSMSGNLTRNNPQAGKIATDPGYVKITLNMMEYTYSIEYIGNMALQLYVPGAHQGWNPATAPFVYCQNYDMKYDGYVNFTADNQGFKFTSEQNWDGTNYGDGGNGTLSTAGGDLKVATAGFYRLTADLSSTPLKYTATKTVWGLIGDATTGGWDSSTPMTLNPETGEWTVTTTLTGGKSFKFRANDAWDINLGGNANNLTYGGDNVSVTSDGTYKVTLKLGNPTAYKFTMVKQ
ncbi:SusF/SusE family outer membrane protein [Bacteroides sedimenti]|uniref:Outer membrane protein SusF n=1 Tax=Bacteroides sedimenti TaxID=2136147 RepID=A0ABM8I9L5_9BACE